MSDRLPDSDLLYIVTECVDNARSIAYVTPDAVVAREMLVAAQKKRTKPCVTLYVKAHDLDFSENTK